MTLSTLVAAKDPHNLQVPLSSCACDTDILTVCSRPENMCHIKNSQFFIDLLKERLNAADQLGATIDDDNVQLENNAAILEPAPRHNQQYFILEFEEPEIIGEEFEIEDSYVDFDNLRPFNITYE